MRFFDRREAGQKLGSFLKQHLPPVQDGLVLSLPRGGVVIGAKVAEILNLPHDIIVTRKIGAAENPEYAVAAVSLNKIVLNSREPIPPTYLQAEIKKERQEIKRRLNVYRGERPFPDLHNKTVILVDDGLATGLTMKAAIAEVKSERPAKIIVAVPVAPTGIDKELKMLGCEVLVLQSDPLFFAVGQFYEHFEPVSDEDVINILKAS